MDENPIDTINCPYCNNPNISRSELVDEGWLCLDCGRTFNFFEVMGMTRTLEHKEYKLAIKAFDEETGTFEGYASTFDSAPDSYGDVVDKGAFTKTIKENMKRIRLLFNHNANEPIGKILELSEDDKGLYFKAKLSLGVQRAREVLALMKDEVITTMSIGYDTITEEWKDKIRHLKEVRLWDISPVTFAANPEAVITGVKSGRVLSATNLSKVQAAINALNALLESAEQDEEPAKSTPPTAKDPEAAELEKAINDLKAASTGFNYKKAEASLANNLKKIEGETK
ncbi:MAG: HK97 family phage prohead protease [Dehalococcoides mccartyi]